MKNEMAIDRLVERLVEVVQQIRSRGVDRLEILQDNSVWYRFFKPQMKELLDVRLAIEELNPEAIDHRTIQIEIHGPVTTAASTARFDEEKFRSEVREEIERLVNYHDRHEIHFQLVNLTVNSAYRFGDVGICPISNTGDTTEHRLKYESPVTSPDPTSIYSYAVVRDAPGYASAAERNAVAAVERVLRLVRAIGLPTLWGRKWKEIGVEGRAPGSSWAIARRQHGQWMIGVNFSLMDWFVPLQTLVAEYTPAEVSALERIYMSKSPSNLERKVLQAHYWMGDATMPGDHAARYARLAIAFETAVGGEAAAKNLKEIGITQMLAERVAFLLGRTALDRVTLHAAVTELYSVRSKLFHGDVNAVDDATLARWALLVWLTVKAVLGKCGDFRTVEKLTEWVREQRYTLPGGSLG